MSQKPPFPEWALAEIARLRAEANAIQRALDLYAGVNQSQPHVTKQPPALKDPSTARVPRASKYDAAFRAFEQAARPLNLDDMLAIARGAGVEIERANLRSVVFVQKNLGRARPVGDRYIWGDAVEETKTAPPEEGGAA